MPLRPLKSLKGVDFGMIRLRMTRVSLYFDKPSTIVIFSTHL